MALVEAFSGLEQQQDYNVAEQELQDHILQVYGTKENGEELFRPCLAEQQKIGFFSLDRSSQTDVTEIVDLKEMTEVIQILLQDVANMRKDIHFAKHVMQADYENKLQQKSMELYCRINERVSDLEKVHQDRVNSVRKAFKQQLADAIARITALWKMKIEHIIKNMKQKQASYADHLEDKNRELSNMLVRNENIIKMLRMQLQQHQQQEGSKARSATPVDNQELEELRTKIAALERKIKRLQEALEIREDEIGQLNKEVEDLNEQVERERILAEQLKHEKNEMKTTVQEDKDSAKKLAEELLEKQKKELEKMFEEKLKLATEEMALKAQRDMDHVSGAEQERIRMLKEEKKRLEELLAKEREKGPSSVPVPSGTGELEFLRRTEVRLREEIQRLKREMDKIHRAWEKKFAILQASLYALKDESYLRQTLQRQAASLHQASVSYTADTPLGIMPTGKHTVMGSPKKPLPDISSGTRRSGPPGTSGHPDKDYISYTVSAPSGRGTALFSVDENQIMSDNEQDLPPDVVPLPDPPPRKTQESEDSRPSTRSHVVILPTAEQT